MRRRAVLATAGTVALAGCTASGDDGAPDAGDYTVRGLEDSDLYHDGELGESSPLATILDGGGEYRLYLQYDPEGDYDPYENGVYLMDGDIVVSERVDRLLRSEGEIMFDLSTDQLADGGQFRVVSKNPVETVDEFELEVVQA